MARRRLSRLLGSLLSGGVLAASVLACSSSDPVPTAVSTPQESVIASPTGYFVDPTTAAAAQVATWEQEGRTDDAEQIRKIAEQPVPLWVSADPAAVEPETRAYVERAQRAGQTPLLVGYNIPHRDCGSFSGGGAADGTQYRQWVTGLAAALDGAGATVVLEPDAVPHEISGCVDGALRDERYELLGEAIDQLKGAGARVYLDAGNPGFITDTGAIAAALERSGVERADGFSLNVANFWSTEDNIAYGTRISAALGGAHFVIDTSRNGAGRVESDQIDGAPSFCNPPGRALGTPPTSETGNSLVDELLWVKRPGESDGACRPGEPAAGVWYPDYALGLAERAA
ncbi:glycoside hydrolase family 6 protein [Pseudonocardia sp. RS010]|uniref:glycoside hydrolase family 6 protein n=1 Tax=Pseudonocardia sp. RS010 TaxID=3385979 RepID=UPI0039A00B15